jgi:hypothetical protein
MSAELREDEELAIMVVGRGYQEFEFAGEGLKRSRGFMSRAVKVYGSVMQFASLELREDEEFFLKAV